MSKIEDEVCKKIQKRAEVGFKKYGKTMEREDFSFLDWLKYLQEELLDSVVYLERIIQDKEKVDSDKISMPSGSKTDNYQDGR